MSEEDIMAKIELNLKLLNSINIKLDKLVNQRTASAIVETLKKEDEIMEETTKQFNNVVKDKLESSEEVLMDTNDVMWSFETEKAVLFVKNKGNHLEQIWIPKSAIDGTYIKDGNMQNIKIHDWFKEKLSWAPFEVRKK